MLRYETRLNPTVIGYKQCRALRRMKVAKRCLEVNRENNRQHNSEGKCRRRIRRLPANGQEFKEFTHSQTRGLQRILKDTCDTTRYLIISQLGDHFTLYYNVSDDLYAMNNPTGGTLFKRRCTAVAVSHLLSPVVKVIRCSTNLKEGKIVPVLPRHLIQPKKGAAK